MTVVDKQRVLAALRARVAEQLDTLTSSQRHVQAGATHAESRQEHPKDTRAIEAQYLARGLAGRVEALWDTVALLNAIQVVPFGADDPIGVTALVGIVDAADREAVYFLVPSGGGETLDVDGVTVQSITPVSPVGQALIGALVGDDVTVELPGRRGVLSVVWVK